MEQKVKKALARDETIDITTIGRKSGKSRRIEIWFRRVGERIYITGTPGPRGWYANLMVNERFTFHLKESVQADLAATARPITDPDERCAILADPAMSWYQNQTGSLDALVQGSPLIEVIFDDQ